MSDVGHIMKSDPRLEVTIDPIDNMWTLVAAILVFFMQAGFGCLEGGSVRTKNAKNILLKNLLDASIGALVWFFIGYALAKGDDSGEFIGKNKFAIDSAPGDLADFFFQWAFAATAATIISGSVAERTKFQAYLVYTVVVTGFIYPVVVHWVWGGGFFASEGVIDFAGSGVVHMTGGLAGLVGAWMIGPRIGRFQDGKLIEFIPHSITFQALGTLILWMGWYGFNAGSTTAMTGTNANIANIVAVNTTLAPAAAAVTMVILELIESCGKSINLGTILNAILGGLVSITAGCNVVEHWSAVVIGAIGAVVYAYSSKLLIKLQIDDPLDAAPVHYFCGMWGVIATGLFAKPDLSDPQGYPYEGLFYDDSYDTGKLLGVQLALVAAITAWVGGLSVVLFAVLKITKNLRVPSEVEEGGLDRHYHGGVINLDLITRHHGYYPSAKEGKISDQDNQSYDEYSEEESV